MALITADCPRCGRKEYTLDVMAITPISMYGEKIVKAEAFAVCRGCERSSIRKLTHKSGGGMLAKSIEKIIADGDPLDEPFYVGRVVAIQDGLITQCPLHVPEDIAAAFKEGAACLSIEAYNGAAAMFRLAIDLATRPLLPDDKAEDGGPNSRTRNTLGPRLTWLFDNGKLPKALHELAQVITHGGNDGVHIGKLTKEEAEDLVDFTGELLEQLYTQPERIRLAQERRAARHGKSSEKKGSAS